MLCVGVSMTQGTGLFIYNNGTDGSLNYCFTTTEMLDSYHVTAYISPIRSVNW